MSRSMRVSAFNLSVTVLLVTIAFVACAKDAARQAASKTTASIDTAAAAQTAATPTGTARASSLVGLAYTTLPSGLTFASGAAIPSASGSASFDLAQVKTPDGDRLLLQTTGPTIAGAPSHLVVADLKLPPVGPGEHLVMASCDVNGKLDPIVVAIVAAEPSTKRLTKVRQAWRANAQAKRFDMIPVDGIVCEEPGSAP